MSDQTTTLLVVDRRGPGRPKSADIPLEAMRRDDGLPLTARQFARQTGFSVDKIRALLRSGHIRGVAVPSGQRTMWLIPFPEAQRWLRDLRII